MSEKAVIRKIDKNAEYIRETIEELQDMADDDYEYSEDEEDEYIDTRMNDEDCVMNINREFYDRSDLVC